MLLRLLIAALWSPAGNGTDLLALVGDVYCIYVTFPCSILGQVWYLIVSFPVLCCLSYFDPILKIIIILYRYVWSQSFYYTLLVASKYYTGVLSLSLPLFLSLSLSLSILTCLNSSKTILTNANYMSRKGFK